MNDIEERVKEMLKRRSQDIGPYPNDLQPPRPDSPNGSLLEAPAASAHTRLGEMPRLLPALSLAAVAVALVLVGGILVATRGDDGASIAAGEGQRIETEPDTEADATQPVGGSGDGTDDGDGVPTEPPAPTIEDFLAGFPAAVNLVSGATIHTDFGVTGAEGQAASYLAKRLLDLPASVTQIDSDGTMTLFRWSVSEADIDEAGLVLVRGGGGDHAVVAATTDGIELVDAERSLDTIEVSITDRRGEDLVVDINTLYGRPIPGVANPDGIGPVDAPIFGTAGFTEGDRIDVALSTDSQTAVVLAQNIGGTMLTVLEFPLDSVGFVDICGSEPPLTIDVGSLLGPLENGPAPQASTAPLANQQVWHYPGAETSIEIRWPADPKRIGRVDPSTIGDSKALSFARSGMEPGGDHVLAVLEPPRSDSAVLDPCSILQFSVLGDPAAVDWWSTALSGELSFGLPLTIADLDPAIGPDGGGDSGEGAPSDELVTGTVEVDAAPRLPETGSCDGLPNDPPRAGQGSPSDPPQTDSRAALEVFLDGTGRRLDPPLGTTGYTELIIDDQNLSYVYPSVDPVVVVNVQLGPGGWQVTNWEASPC